MQTAAAHYKTHLGPIYAWMLGDIQAALARSRARIATLRKLRDNDPCDRHYRCGRRLGSCFSSLGICRFMNSLNRGTVKAVSPWR